MKQSNKTEWAIWGVCALSFAVTLALLPLLPARIPVHWNVDGQIDGWAARPGAFFGPAMGLGLSLLMKFLPYIDPRRRSYEKFGRAYDAFRLALALFVLILQGVTLYAAFYPDGLDVSRIIAACVGALLCVAGNYMPKFRHNYFCGIRTPWTLASETCWRRTHRFAGRCGSGAVWRWRRAAFSSPAAGWPRPRRLWEPCSSCPLIFIRTLFIKAAVKIDFAAAMRYTILG